MISLESVTLRRHYRASDHGGATGSPGETVVQTPKSFFSPYTEPLTLGQDWRCEVLQVSVFAQYFWGAVY